MRFSIGQEVDLPVFLVVLLCLVYFGIGSHIAINRKPTPKEPLVNAVMIGFFIIFLWWVYLIWLLILGKNLDDEGE